MDFSLMALYCACSTAECSRTDFAKKFKFFIRCSHCDCRYYWILQGQSFVLLGQKMSAQHKLTLLTLINVPGLIPETYANE